MAPSTTTTADSAGGFFRETSPDNSNRSGLPPTRKATPIESSYSVARRQREFLRLGLARHQIRIASFRDVDRKTELWAQDERVHANRLTEFVQQGSAAAAAGQDCVRLQPLSHGRGFQPLLESGGQFTRLANGVDIAPANGVLQAAGMPDRPDR